MLYINCYIFEVNDMPPKQKINKELILHAAFDLIKEEGIAFLNARNLAKKIGCSTQPIFSYYQNMDALKNDLYWLVEEYHQHFFDQVKVGPDLFVEVALTYIDFALTESHLFRFLFMSQHYEGEQIGHFATGPSCNQHLIESLPSHIDRFSPQIQDLFTDMWIYAHGIASMMITNRLDISKKELRKMVTRMFGKLCAEERVDNCELPTEE